MPAVPQKSVAELASRFADVRICILRIEGTNCEQEMHEAFRLLGASPEIVHLKQLIGEVAPSYRRSLGDYHIMMLPGGFSSGDYVRAGAILSARIKAALSKELGEFVEDGRPVGGVCNGFQVLVELGMLPGFDGPMKDTPDACLAVNDSGRFECRPTYLKVEPRTKCVFTSKLEPDDVIMCPSAHGEGKLLFRQERQSEYLSRLFSNGQVVFRYCDPDGSFAGYPWNPNGSPANIAGICDPSGTVFGMMPHPERVFWRYQHPDWTRDERKPDSHGDGRAIFESVLEYVAERL